mmetsp:Transcript_123351/g.356505  ORF Transcript_123351/g.356505 Transcript_123351/m.356505 type:complete len:530 (+) Transcript_123351:92-1681(+)
MGCCRSAAAQPPEVLAAALDAAAVPSSPSEAPASCEPPCAEAVSSSAVPAASGGPSVVSAEVTAAAEFTAGEALSACRIKLDLGDVTGAEEVLLAALQASGSEDHGEEFRRIVVDLIRSSPEYAETLREATWMEQVIHDVLGPGSGIAGGWTFAAEVKADFTTLGMRVDDATRQVLEGVGATGIKIFYASAGKTLNLKITGIIPTQVGFTLPALASFVAMYHETELWKQWHPIIHGNGPTELWRRRPYHNLWHVPVRAVMQSICELIEERMFFIRDRGIFVMALDGKTPGDELWKQFPPPKGFKAMPGANKTKLVVAVQKHTTAFTLTASIEGEVAIPDFIVRFVVTWLAPEVTRRMLRAGAACLKRDGPHSAATTADSEGVYAESVSLSARGAELDDAESRAVYCPGAMPSPEAVCSSRASLVAFEREHLQAKSVAGDSFADATAAPSTLEPTTPAPRDAHGDDNAAALESPAEGVEDNAISCERLWHDGLVGDSDDRFAKVEVEVEEQQPVSHCCCSSGGGNAIVCI